MQNGSEIISAPLEWVEPSSRVAIAVVSVIEALRSRQYDFRTIDGIKRETGLEKEFICQILSLDFVARPPMFLPPNGQKLFTDYRRKPRWRETWTFLHALLSID